ncbi:MAG: [citrate (pro-3S)-lyase] ligase, partial [Fusobacteriaceae bacterium]
SLDEDVDYTIVLRDNFSILGTASKSKNIIKCFALDEKLRGEGFTNTFVTNLLNKAFEEGYFHNFIFTTPKNIDIFKAIGFSLISSTDKVALLEIGTENITRTIENIKKEYLQENGIFVKNKKRALIVMNCNPFTLGHQYLIERASSENDEVIIFVVQEDKSSFNFKVRYQLVKEGTSHLQNVKVIPGTQYIISSATFPNYFLRKDDDALLEYIKLDVTVTAEYFCKKLGITRRYVGEEPYCKMTEKYNHVMVDLLNKQNIEVVIVPRKEFANKGISASEVRNLIKQDKTELLKNLVPETTYNFLMSKEGKEIGQKIKNSNSAH